jgi:hypothetical protein
MHTTFRVYGSAIGRTALCSRTVGRGFKSVSRIIGRGPIEDKAYEDTVAQMERAMSNMLTPEQQDEWDQKVYASAQVKKNADEAEAAEAKAARKAEKRKLKQKAAALAEAEAKAKAEAEAKAEKRRLKQEAAALAQREADANEDAVTVTESVTAASTEAEAKAARKAEKRRLKQEAAALAQREADANEDALQPAPLNEAERLVDLDDAIAAEEIVVQQETSKNTTLMTEEIQQMFAKSAFGEGYGVSFERVMLDRMQPLMKSLIGVPNDSPNITDFVVEEEYKNERRYFNDNRETITKYAPFDAKCPSAVFEFKNYNTTGFSINIPEMIEGMKYLESVKSAYYNEYINCIDLDIRIRREQEYNTYLQDQYPEVYTKHCIKVQITKFNGVYGGSNTSQPKYIWDKTTNQYLLHSLRYGGIEQIKHGPIPIYIIVWTQTGLYYFNPLSDISMVKFENSVTRKIVGGPETAVLDSKGNNIGNIKLKYNITMNKGYNKNVYNFPAHLFKLLPMNKILRRKKNN